MIASADCCQITLLAPMLLLLLLCTVSPISTENKGNNKLDHNKPTNATSNKTITKLAGKSHNEETDETEEETGGLGLDPHGYLSKFGYTPQDESITNVPVEDESVAKAIKLFQTFFNLPLTDDVDERTLALMKRRRCGNVDLEVDAKGRAEVLKDKKQMMTYALAGHKWPNRRVSYKISRYPEKFIRQRRAINNLFARAFEVWSREANLDFYSLSAKQGAKADIEIIFVRSDYGTCYRCALFDGSESHLAHAFYPSVEDPIGGDIHFNDLVDWSITADGGEGEDLLAVAVHEIGHSLGLGHGQFAKTKMYPIVNGSMLGLDRFDIAGIRAIYGKRQPPTSTTGGPTTTTTTTTQQPPDFLTHID